MHTDVWIVKKNINKNRSHYPNGLRYKYGTQLKDNIWGDLGASWGVEMKDRTLAVLTSLAMLASLLLLRRYLPP